MLVVVPAGCSFVGGFPGEVDRAISPCCDERSLLEPSAVCGYTLCSKRVSPTPCSVLPSPSTSRECLFGSGASPSPSSVVPTVS